MPRRCTGVNNTSSDYEPPRKKSSDSISKNVNVDLKEGEIVTDVSGKKWRLGKPIGIGGFGEIYLVSENLAKDVCSNTPYVAKIEKHSNGPLFVEVNCYLRIGKTDMIEKWEQQNNLDFLGMPHYVASGSLNHKDEKYRFLILPKYDKDLEAVIQSKKLLNFKTVLVIATHIVNVLEYIHSNGYVHSDIKASNILLGKSKPFTKKVVSKTVPTIADTRRIVKHPFRFGYTLPRYVPSKAPNPKKSIRSLRNKVPISYVDDIPYLDDILEKHEKRKYFLSPKKPKTSEGQVDIISKKNSSVERLSQNLYGFTGEEVYLLDYGLATKYILSNGDHREFSTDERRAHAGTVLFCSRDAHEGVPSRRSDLECLSYNMVYWLTGSLPWIDDIADPELVEKKKKKCFNNLEVFLQICFPEKMPGWLLEFCHYLNKLEFEETPNYNFCRNLFKKAIQDYGYKDDSKLDFENIEISKVKKKKGKLIRRCPILITNNTRIPLHSNIIFKRPKLRKKLKDKYAKCSMMNWSRILITDPETVIRQKTRNRKNTEGSDPGSSNILSMDLDGMNPTPAMLEVYNRCVEREEMRSPPGSRGDEISISDSVEGYTPEMVRIHMLMKERREFEFEEAVRNNETKRTSSRNSKIKSGSCKKRASQQHTRRVKRSESPPNKMLTSKASKSQTFVSQAKKEASPFRKLKHVPLKRVYSLRG